jgi:hypothetical protein
MVHYRNIPVCGGFGADDYHKCLANDRLCTLFPVWIDRGNGSQRPRITPKTGRGLLFPVLTGLLVLWFRQQRAVFCVWTCVL